ncbi:FAD-dependent oxidoreductase-like enzyme [Sporothrix brasiliensis 5110]|uniref:FAD-dependent oxidoreductase-like enzyme n=1 Tax=Sporothrix brasiliensis 5110 TaxID=1398154 RepID=A0A0C2FRP3_9PEZI|nr:FAD-dependent oxidoreductase-like enzyme [Sporothrix brasiliensis 5110]KIH93638.1 FAD-dependent oxidoreductase-like enzyme [Sporothrix brasiliensis 5110]
MSSDSEPPPSGQTPAAAAAAASNAVVDMDMDSDNVPHNSVEVPSTPLGAAMGAETVIPASQETILSTEGPGSPMDADESFRTELNDHEDENLDVEVETAIPSMIPSSLTPPPSSQHRAELAQQQRHPLPRRQPPSHSPSTAAVNGNHVSSAVSQSSAIPSPPGTGLTSVAQARRDAAAAAALGLGPAASSAAAAVAAAAAAAAVAGNSSPLLGGATDFVPPTPAQIADATPDELRAMLQASLAEHTRLKTETAHHKLQYNLLTLQADEDAKRAAVEHEMTRREVEALRAADRARQARRDLSTSSATETSEAKYRQLKTWYDEAAEENELLQKRVKLAKRVIQQKEEEMAGLVDEKELLLNRLRENREHFHLLCSPGGLFHGAMTPKPHSSPVHARTTPYQTPKRGTATTAAPATSTSTSTATSSHANHASAEPFAALLQALNQENNSAPNTPLTGHCPPPRHVAKHVRNVQSLSSLPTTPTSRPRGGEYAGLLPSVDLVPQTEPPPARSGGVGHGHSHSVSHSHSQGFTTSASGRYFPETPTRPRHRLPGHPGAAGAPAGGRRSRESTISVDEDAHGSHSHSHSNTLGHGPGGSSGSSGRVLSGNEDIARQALESVARTTTQSFPPPSFGTSRSARPLDRSTSSSSGTAADEHVFESQASQAASAMLRRDARESFEVAAAREASREREAAGGSSGSKMQAKLFGGVNKAGHGPGAVDKRKFSGAQHPTHASAHGAEHEHHHGLGDDRHGSAHPQASPTKKVRVVPSLRDTTDSYRHHHHHHHHQSYQHPSAAQDPDRVGLGIRYD